MLFSYTIFCIISIFVIICGFKVQKYEEKKVALAKEDSVILRGIAALCVMLSHYALWIESYLDAKLPPYFLPLKQLGGIGVLIFFFLSGYGIYLSSSHEKTELMWLIKRVGKVYCPYIFMKLIIEIINYSVIGWNKFLLKDFCVGITGTDFSDWFIWVIILQYVIFWISCRICFNKRLTGIFFLSLMLMAVFIILKLAPRWYNGLLLFWFGCLIAKYQTRLIEFLRQNYYLKLCLIVVGFTGISILYIFLKGGVLAECFKIISGMILGIVLITFLMKLRIQSSVLDWIGKRSLFVYIIHVNLWGIICHVVESTNLVLPLAVGSAFLVSGICYEGYERLGKIHKRK